MEGWKLKMTEPIRVTARVAMRMLDIHTWGLFRKVVDANPDLVHRLPGETRARYSVAVIQRLMSVRCVAPGEGQPQHTDERSAPAQRRA